MNEQMNLRLPHQTRRALLDMLRNTGDLRSMHQVVDLAVRNWLAEAARANPAAARASTRGYQWKSLFLPDGTLLRFTYDGIVHDASVRGDAIVYQGRRVSPRQWLWQVTGTVRNAWLTLWLRCPGDVRWHLADTRRRILRRTPAAAAPVQAAPQRAAVDEHAATLRRALDSIEALRARRRQAYLRRSDQVREDQPDLSLMRPSGRGVGPHGAGRAGPRDRRLPVS